MSGCALPSTDDRYGRVCPTCAGPKWRQSSLCKDCYYDLQRARHADAAGRHDVCACGRPKKRESARCLECYFAERRLGLAGPGGRPQSQDHPWRRKNDQLFKAAA